MRKSTKLCLSYLEYTHADQAKVLVILQGQFSSNTKKKKEKKEKKNNKKLKKKKPKKYTKSYVNTKKIKKNRKKNQKINKNCLKSGNYLKKKGKKD